MPQGVLSQSQGDEWYADRESKHDKHPIFQAKTVLREVSFRLTLLLSNCESLFDGTEEQIDLCETQSKAVHQRRLRKSCYIGHSKKLKRFSYNA